MNSLFRFLSFKGWFLSLLTSLMLAISINANALVLTRGTETHLTGTLGDVQVNYVDDSVYLSGYLSSSGLVMDLPEEDWILTRRIQYDVLNNSGNDSIFSLRINYDPGVTVLAAADPEGFHDGVGDAYGYWGGSAYATLFDSGYGVYDYDVDYGSEWTIEYAADHVTWNHFGNGFFDDTATGFTEYGFYPTFALYFAPDTEFGMRDAFAYGFETDATGQVLTGINAVPEPGTLSLLALGLLAAVGFGKRRYSD